ncbi:hypothetical protein [Chroogloeocystis siderophila]|uniref:hypothetical protein n=1 Tax=Chroogloeocystis siderophila TaxID=329163 RepID=UPI001F2E0CC9|nr:hypothetical protein [Chroogloeocystis siderophila]
MVIKARYEIFNTEMHVQAMARLQLENDLRRAIERTSRVSTLLSTDCIAQQR